MERTTTTRAIEVPAVNAVTGEQVITTIHVPVGSIYPPTILGMDGMNSVLHPQGWKLATDAFITSRKDEADYVLHAMIWYLGGGELEERETENGPEYVVKSKGYYYYEGA